MAHIGKNLVTSTPGKFVWILGATSVNLVQLPVWLVYFVRRGFRPHVKWTYLQSIMNHLMNAFLYHSSMVQVKTALRLEPGTEKERFVRIEPADPDFYRGVLKDTDIQPTIVGGTWFPNRYQPQIDDHIHIVLYFHGGAFVLGEGRTADCGFAGETLAKHLNAKVLSLTYRLSCHPGCQFPAALQDALAAYRYLLGEGIPAESLILAGDSAGANLAIALLRYIADNPSKLPSPLAAVLFSPWVDLASGCQVRNVSTTRNHTTDYVPDNFIRWGARAYTASREPSDPYLSPINHPFSTKTRLWICVGGLESLHDDGVRFAENMRKKGNDVEVHVELYANHAILGVGNLTGFAVEAQNAVKLAQKWLSRRHPMVSSALPGFQSD